MTTLKINEVVKVHPKFPSFQSNYKSVENRKRFQRKRQRVRKENKCSNPTNNVKLNYLKPTDNVTKGRLTIPVKTGLFLRGIGTAFVSRNKSEKNVLGLNRLNQARMNENLHEILNIAQGKSHESSDEVEEPDRASLFNIDNISHKSCKDVDDNLQKYSSKKTLNFSSSSEDDDDEEADYKEFLQFAQDVGYLNEFVTRDYINDVKAKLNTIEAQSSNNSLLRQKHDQELREQNSSSRNCSQDIVCHSHGVQDRLLKKDEETSVLSQRVHERLYLPAPIQNEVVNVIISPNHEKKEGSHRDIRTSTPVNHIIYKNKNSESSSCSSQLSLSGLNPSTFLKKHLKGEVKPVISENNCRTLIYGTRIPSSKTIKQLLLSPDTSSSDSNSIPIDHSSLLYMETKQYKPLKRDSGCFEIHSPSTSNQCALECSISPTQTEVMPQGNNGGYYTKKNLQIQEQQSKKTQKVLYRTHGTVPLLPRSEFYGNIAKQHSDNIYLDVLSDQHYLENEEQKAKTCFQNEEQQSKKTQRFIYRSHCSVPLFHSPERFGSVPLQSLEGPAEVDPELFYLENQRQKDCHSTKHDSIRPYFNLSPDVEDIYSFRRRMY